MLAFAIGPMVAAAISLVTLPFVAWFFSPEDVGRLTMLQVMLSLGSLLFTLGMNQAYVREYHEEVDKARLFKNAILPGSLLLLGLVVVVLLQPYSLSKLLFGLDSPTLTAYLLTSIISSFFIYFFGHVVRMQERGLAFSITQIVPKLLLVVLIAIVLIFKLPAVFQTLMLMNTVAILSTFIIVAWLTRDTWYTAVFSEICYASLRKMLIFSLPLVLGSLAYWGLNTSDRFFLRNYAGFEELGIYSMSASLAGGVAVLSTIFSNIWHPVVYKWIKQGVNVEKIVFVTETMLVAVSLVWSLIGSLSWLLRYLLPEEYRVVQYLITASVAGPLLYILSETTVVGINISRKSGYAMLASVTAFFVSAGLNFIFIPKYGASAAAISSMIAFFVFFTVRTECSVRLWQPIPRLRIYLAILAYMVTTCIFVSCQQSSVWMPALWLMPFLFVCLIFSARVKDLLSVMSNKITFIK